MHFTDQVRLSDSCLCLSGNKKPCASSCSKPCPRWALFPKLSMQENCIKATHSSNRKMIPGCTFLNAWSWVNWHTVSSCYSRILLHIQIPPNLTPTTFQKRERGRKKKRKKKKAHGPTTCDHQSRFGTAGATGSRELAQACAVSPWRLTHRSRPTNQPLMYGAWMERGCNSH